jgi:hypothetical protein
MRVTLGEGDLRAAEAIVWRRLAGILVAVSWFLFRSVFFDSFQLIL